MNEAVNFLKKLSAPIPPYSGMSEEQILEKQRESEAREQELNEKLELMKKKKKEEEEREFESNKRSQIDDSKQEVQTPKTQDEEATEKQDSRFMRKVKDVVHRADETLDKTAEEIEAGASRAYTRSKAGTKQFLKDTQRDFQKATEYKPPKKSHHPLVSAEDKRRSAEFAVRDYERRHSTPQSDFREEETRKNPFFGFSGNDINGYGELSRDAFSLDTSQFGFSLIGDSEKFGGAMYQDEKPFGGFNVKQERGFNVSYSGEFGAFRHRRNESFSFLPKPPKNPHKRKNVKRKNQPRGFDISRLIL